MSAFVSAVIVAAGGSVRMGIADSKQFIPLLSRPAIEYTLKAFQKCHLIKEIVIVCREQDNDRINKIIELNGFNKVKHNSYISKIAETTLKKAFLSISNIKKNGTIFFREVLPMQSILSILPMLSVTYVVT